MYLGISFEDNVFLAWPSKMLCRVYVVYTYKFLLNSCNVMIKRDQGIHIWSCQMHHPFPSSTAMPDDTGVQ